MSIGGAVLDTNVLFGMLLRDTFLRLANPGLGLYVPYWSDITLIELEENLFEQRVMNENAAKEVVGIIRDHFPDAIVYPPRPLIEQMTNDEGDRHVLAAAVFVRALFVVTFDVHDFGRIDCERYGIESIEPDDFLHLLYLTSPEDVIVSLVDQVAGYRREPTTMEGLIKALYRDAPKFSYTIQDDFDRRDLEEQVETRREELREQELA